MEAIKQLILDNKADEAIRLVDEIIAADPQNDEAYYLRGNAWRKKGNMQLAINNYLEAMEINPESPARQAHAMMMKIMNFFNKDMYNH